MFVIAIPTIVVYKLTYCLPIITTDVSDNQSFSQRAIILCHTLYTCTFLYVKTYKHAYTLKLCPVGSLSIPELLLLKKPIPPAKQTTQPSKIESKFVRNTGKSQIKRN